MTTHHPALQAPVPSSDRPVISVVGLCKSYRSGEQEVVALDGVCLEASRGDIVVLMGVSGSGKSTLIGILGSLLRPDSGEVVVAGNSMSDLSRSARADFRRSTASVVFQEYLLISLLTAGENVSLPLELSGTDRRSAQERARAKLGELGLADYPDRYPGELSGGQRQRVAIARALAGGHPVILADEPTGALDSETAAVLRETFVTAARSGATVVIATHDPQFADIASAVIRLRDGRVVTTPAA